MGRRKIEIQPILNDRNRSVTFLKRKNGLMKKAYELGVLCGCDIQVIIFGHNQKLYEYTSSTSSNPNKIVDRRANFNGEHEIRGPQDYTDKNDDADADGVDEDSDDPTPSTKQNGRASRSTLPKRSAVASSSRMPEPRNASPSPPRHSSHNPGKPTNGQVLPSISSLSRDRQASSNSRMAEGPTSPRLALAQLLSNPNGSHGLSGQSSSSFPPDSLEAAQSLNQNPSASLAQILATNPYLASQLGSSLSHYTGVLGGQGFGLGLASPGGIGGPLGVGGHGLHPLYSLPLFASLLAGAQSQSLGSSYPSMQPSQTPFSNIPGQYGSAPEVPDFLRGSLNGGGSQTAPPTSFEWPASGSDSHRPQSNPSSSQADSSANQGATWLEFLNAISNQPSATNLRHDPSSPNDDRRQGFDFDDLPHSSRPRKRQRVEGEVGMASPPHTGESPNLNTLASRGDGRYDMGDFDTDRYS